MLTSAHPGGAASVSVAATTAAKRDTRAARAMNPGLFFFGFMVNHRRADGVLGRQVNRHHFFCDNFLRAFLFEGIAAVGSADGIEVDRSFRQARRSDGISQLLELTI